MSHLQTINFEESWMEAQEEKDYFKGLLQQAIQINHARRANALQIRKIALQCLDRGYVSFTDYVTICEKNNVPIF